MSRVFVGRVVAAVVVFGALVLVGPARAYPRYNSGCQTCHGAFTTDPYVPSGGAAWPADLHTVHRSASFMDAECDLCHSQGDQRNPFIGTSDGTAANAGVGCTGCHGRDYAGSVEGRGLIAHHLNAGIAVCSDCHAAAAPAPESVSPPYYGTVDTAVEGPCDPALEDWSGDGVGLDNDGDGLYEAADPDCAAGPVCGNSVVETGETCDPPAACPTSCDDADACTTDALVGAAETCDAECVFTEITACVDGDGCCPAGCGALEDTDCGGPPDGGPGDAGPDGGEDAGVEDAGFADAGLEDAGGADAGPQDAGLEDAGEDAGVADAGDAGPPDAAFPDGAVPDAGALPEVAEGCTCGAPGGGSAGLVFAALGLVLLRRRRSRRAGRPPAA